MAKKKTLKNRLGGAREGAGRKKLAEDVKTVAVKMPVELVDWLASVAAQREQERDGFGRVTISDVLRSLVAVAKRETL